MNIGIKMLKILKNTTVLLLEDDPEFSEYMADLLYNFVKMVHCASTIDQASAVYNSEHIDFIVSDIKLKNENGLNFIRNVRLVDTKTPVIVLSGHKDEELLFTAMTLKLTVYLLKPINYAGLIQGLHECAIVLGLNQTHKLKPGWIYDPNKESLETQEQNYALNKKEALFIQLLCENTNRIITKEMIHLFVWEDSTEMSDSAVKNFIMRIRKRFGKDFIYTIPDIGYRLNTN